MLIKLMENSNDYCKSTKHTKYPPPNIQLYHLDEVVSTGKFINIIGYVVNSSHSNPTIENGFLVPVT